MSGEVRTILLLPHADRWERMLDPGVMIYSTLKRIGWVATCKGKPWVLFDDAGSDPGGWPVSALPGRPPEVGDRLVLALDGAVVTAGPDRLSRLIGVGLGLDEIVRKALGQVHPSYTPDELQGMRNALENTVGSLGRVVYLDEHQRVIEFPAPADLDLSPVVDEREWWAKRRAGGANAGN